MQMAPPRALEAGKPRSHRSTWTRRPAYPQIRLGDNQSVEFLVVGDAWTFDLPSKNDHFKSVRHLANIVCREQLTDPFHRTCFLFEFNDTTFRSVVVDPTKHWLKVTRYGVGKSGTHYKVEVVRQATDNEREMAGHKIRLDLELAASDKQSKMNR